MQDRVETGEKTCIKSTGHIGFGECSNLAAVDVKDGKIVRIRSFPYTWRYKPEEFHPWKMEARGKTFEPPLKSMPVDLDELSRRYPEAFNRPYDGASGLRFERVLDTQEATPNSRRNT